MENEKVLAIVLGAIKILLRNENYSSQAIKVAINWNYTEIKDFVEFPVKEMEE